VGAGDDKGEAVIKTVGDPPATTAPEGTWLDVDAIAEVTVSSEDPGCPIDDALRGRGRGWRASTPGVQHVVLRFREPTTVRRIRLVFDERSRARTQEFALDWEATSGGPPQNVVRQQFTFAPPGTSTEAEDYATDLADAVRLELTIVPDIGDPTAVASLKEWRIGAPRELRAASSASDVAATPVPVHE
jgi:hypothetical protein